MSIRFDKQNTFRRATNSKTAAAHSVTRIRYGKSHALSGGGYAREMFIETADGETLELNLFAPTREALRVQSVGYEFPSIERE